MPKAVIQNKQGKVNKAPSQGRKKANEICKSAILEYLNNNFLVLKSEE